MRMEMELKQRVANRLEKSITFIRHRAAAVLVLAAALIVGFSSRAAAQQVEYYHLDALGSVRAVTDENGDVITRHDYLPYGEEWNEPPSNDTRRFTGKERDSETGLDYFGARYYGARVGIFASFDPVMTMDANLEDPQRWNRFAYARGNPIKFVDPTGKVLELVGEQKEEAINLLRRMTGADPDSLSIYEDGGRTLVTYKSSELRGKSGMGALLAGLVDAERTVQLSVGHAPGFLVESKYQTETLGGFFGGGATVGSEESLIGVTQVFIAHNAGSAATTAMSSILGRGKSEGGRRLGFSNATVLAHELGHAYANVHGRDVWFSARTHPTALFWENTYRADRGDTKRRVKH